MTRAETQRMKFPVQILQVGKNKTTITIEWMTKIQMLLKEGAQILRDTAEYFTDGALNIPLKAPRRCFSYGFCPLNVCKIIVSYVT